jgi:hypothetical protein
MKLKKLNNTNPTKTGKNLRFTGSVSYYSGEVTKWA